MLCTSGCLLGHLLCTSTTPPTHPTTTPISDRPPCTGHLKEVCLKESVAVLSSSRDGYAARCFLNACSSGADRWRGSGVEKRGSCQKYSRALRPRVCVLLWVPQSRKEQEPVCASFCGASVRRMKGHPLRCPPTQGPGNFLRIPHQHVGAALSLLAREACT